MIMFFSFLFFLKFSTQENQITYHLFGNSLDSTYFQLPFYGVTGKYDEKNRIGSIAGAFSYFDSTKSEMYVFFGYNMKQSDDVWVFSEKKLQWKFVKGRHGIGSNKSLFNETNVFEKDIQIEGRSFFTGWKNQEEVDIFTFFGGSTVSPASQDIWSYNISSNMFAVNHYSSSLLQMKANITDPDDYHEFNFPSGRSHHCAVSINNNEVLLIGGSGIISGEFSIDYLSDSWTFSNNLMQWKFNKGNVYAVEENIVFGDTNKYHVNNTIGSRSQIAGTLINPEEVLLFGGYLARFGEVNIVQKYNITNNFIKYVSGTKTFSNPHYPVGYLTEYDQENMIGGRGSHKMWKINEEEVIIFGGNGESSSGHGYLNDLWLFNYRENLWKFAGKEETKKSDRYSNVPNYPETGLFNAKTVMGGLQEYVGEFVEKNNHLLICTGKGFSLHHRNLLLEVCWSIYLGNICQSLKETNPIVCSTHGSCEAYDFCKCDEGFFGNDCELTKCHGVLSNSSEVCSRKGLCMNGKCLCFERTDYQKDDCSIDEEKKALMNNLWLMITVPVLAIVMIFIFVFSVSFFVFILFRLIKKLKKYDGIEDIEIVLAEQSAKKNTQSARFKINKTLFEIDSKDITILDQIGQGGSNAIIYEAIWEQQKVAYKCFVVQDFLQENKFKEFEQEVEFMASINFPFILSFFGATLNSQRLGFVMEFAENGDLSQFLKKYKKRNSISYPISEKLRMLHEISSALTFLHQKNIIHRDLKLQNVLVTKKEETKLMDFGLSKIIQNDLTKTKKVGTSFYMAPEVLSGHYSYPCDVYSFAILSFVVLTENFFPYRLNNEFAVYNQLLKNPNLRPNIEEMDELDTTKEIIDKLKYLITKNWKYEPTKRMKFEEVTDILNKLCRKKKEKSDTESMEKKRIRELMKENSYLKSQNQKHLKSLFENEKEILRLKEMLPK